MGIFGMFSSKEAPKFHFAKPEQAPAEFLQKQCDIINSSSTKEELERSIATVTQALEARNQGQYSDLINFLGHAKAQLDNVFNPYGKSEANIPHDADALVQHFKENIINRMQEKKVN